MQRGGRFGARAAGVLLLLLLAACAGVAAGCGSSDDGSTSTAASTGSGTAETGSKEPIKIGQILPVGGEVSYPSRAAALRGAVRSINAGGGIDGHPVEIVFCNEANDPNAAAACARKLVDEGVVAEVGGVSLTAEKQIATILDAAGIPQVADTALSQGFLDTPNQFLLSSGIGEPVGNVKTCIDAGYKKIGIPYLDLPSSPLYLSMMKSVAEKSGGEVVSTVSVPATATDVSAAASELRKAGATCIAPVLLNFQAIAMLNALKQFGGDYKVAIAAGAYTAEQWEESLSQFADDLVVTSHYPPVSAADTYPELKQFQADMKAQRDSGDKDANTGQFVGNDINVWLGAQAIKKVMEDGDVEPSPAALMAALKKVDGLELGLIPPWKPNNPGPDGYSRLWGVYEFQGKYDDGELVLTKDEPVNHLDLLGL